MTTITFDKLYWEKANPFRFVLPYFHDCQSRLKNDVALLAAAYIRKWVYQTIRLKSWLDTFCCGLYSNAAYIGERLTIVKVRYIIQFIPYFDDHDLIVIISDIY